MVWTGNTMFGTHLALDILLFLAIFYRPIVAQLCLSKQDIAKRVHFVNADLSLMVLFLIYMIVDFLAIGENLIRNLEHIGFSEEFAKQFWSWTLIYDGYEEIKRTLNIMEFLVIWSTIKKIGSEKLNHKMLKT